MHVRNTRGRQVREAARLGAGPITHAGCRRLGARDACVASRFIILELSTISFAALHRTRRRVRSFCRRC